ncbi:MAG: class D sortase [Clostridia bacterium]|nr:class D sortase [Clostridia bacterium]
MSKNKTMIIIAVLLFLIGVCLLLIDPIKNMMRDEKTDEALQIFEENLNMTLGDDSVITFVVPAKGNEINGEGYDLFDVVDEAAQSAHESALEELPDDVTLTYVGIIEIESVDIKIPIWDSTSVVALRYGAGKYEESAYPGEGKNCTILGHRMRAEGKLFHSLGEVKLDDVIRITLTDGKEMVYVVDQIETIVPEDLENYIMADCSDTERLTLVTCTPLGNPTHRLIVIAHPLGEN